MLEINLKGRKAFVTGGSRGIGAGICRAFARCGANLAFTYKSNQGAATSLVAELKALEVNAAAYQASACDETEMAKAVESAADLLNGLDIVVANVGQNWVASLPELSIDDWRKGIDINLNSVYIAVKLTYPYLNNRSRGDILLIGSSGVFDGGGGSPFYAAAKSGMVGMMYNLMRELPSQNIRINTIHPCVVDTDLLRERYNTEDKIASLAAQVPLGRLSTADDIGNLAAFLCSDLGSFITGQSILVDGGRTLWKK